MAALNCLCSFSTLTSILVFWSFLYLFLVMSNLTVEKLKEILKGKLRKVIQPLSKQIEDAMQSVNARNSKYDQIAKTLKDLDEAKDKQILENASLKAAILKSSNEVKFLKKSLNDLEQYTRRDCLEIQRNTSTLDTDGSGPK